MEIDGIKIRPILFSGPMIRAILESRKTQTRRVIKPQPGREAGLGMAVNPWSEQPSPTQAVFFRGPTVESQSVGEPVKCPYGRPGERLWVRESFAPNHPYDHEKIMGPIYRADYDYEPALNENGILQAFGWKPSIYMPRLYSRITLEITNIKVERVQDITHEDAVAEGFPEVNPSDKYPHGKTWGRLGFSQTWDKINLERGYGWEANPWVWVVEFKKIG